MSKTAFKKRLVELGYNMSTVDINLAFSAYKRIGIPGYLGKPGIP